MAVKGTEIKKECLKVEDKKMGPVSEAIAECLVWLFFTSLSALPSSKKEVNTVEVLDTIKDGSTK